MNQQDNIRILFTPKADSALNEIMEKYKLEESLEEKSRKANENKSVNIVVIDHLAKGLALGIVSNNDLANLLKKGLEITRKTAEQISEDIIAKIIPFLEKVPEGEENNSELSVTAKATSLETEERPVKFPSFIIAEPSHPNFGKTEGGLEKPLKQSTDLFRPIKKTSDAQDKYRETID